MPNVWTASFNGDDGRIEHLLKISRGHALRDQALVLLDALGTEAATPEVLSLLDTRLRTASREEATAIAIIFRRKGPAGEDRLRQVLMELCVHPEGSFFYRAVSRDVIRDPFSVKSVPELHEIFAAAAWERLDASAVRDWLERMAPVLCDLPNRSELPPPSPHPMIPLARPATELQQALVFLVLTHCLRRAPESFDRIHSVFTGQGAPGVILDIAGLLTEPQAKESVPPVLRTPWNRAELDAKHWSAALIHLIPPGSRQVVLRALLDMARHQDAAIASQAVAQIKRMREYAAGKEVAARLLELSDRQGSAGQEAAEALVEINNEETSPEALQALTRVLRPGLAVAADLEGSFFFSLPGKVKQPSVFENLSDLLAKNPDTGIGEVLESLRQRARRRRGPPDPFDRGKGSDGIGRAVERIADIARKSPDAKLIEKCLPLLTSGSPLKRWCGLRIAGSVGAEHRPAPVEPLLEPVSKLAADSHELVRQEATRALAALQMVVETNVALDRVDKSVKHIDPSLPRLEYARQLLSVLKAPPMRTMPPEGNTPWPFDSAPFPAAVPPEPAEPRSVEPSEARPPEPSEPGSVEPSEARPPEPAEPRSTEAPPDIFSILADLRDPDKRDAARGAIWRLADTSAHQELLPALTSALFDPAGASDDLIPAFVSTLERNLSSAEAAAAIETVASRLSSPVDSVRRTAFSVAGTPPWDASLFPSILDGAADRDPAIRQVAFQTLASFPAERIDREVVPRLPGWLADAAPETRLYAARLVRALGEEACTSQVIAGLRLLIEDSRIVFENRMRYRVWYRDTIREEAIQALGALGECAFEPAISILLNLLLEPAMHLSLAAVRAAFSMGPQARRRVLEVLVSIASPQEQPPSWPSLP